MGKIKQGILGGFSGKVGTVIGSFWKGKSYMRGLNNSYNDAKTPAQLTQRMRFAKCVSFLKVLLPVVQVGYKHQAAHMTEMNVGMRQMMDNAVSGVYPDVVVDYTKVMLGSGPLTSAMGVLLSQSSDKLLISWDDESMLGNCSGDDVAVVAIYNPSSDQVVYNLEGATRESQSDSYVMPVHWSGQKVYCYMGFQSADGLAISNIINVGELQLA